MCLFMFIAVFSRPSFTFCD